MEEAGNMQTRKRTSEQDGYRGGRAWPEERGTKLGW